MGGSECGPHSDNRCQRAFGSGEKATTDTRADGGAVVGASPPLVVTVPLVGDATAAGLAVSSLSRLMTATYASERPLAREVGAGDEATTGVTGAETAGPEVEADDAGGDGAVTAVLAGGDAADGLPASLLPPATALGAWLAPAAGAGVDAADATAMDGLTGDAVIAAAASGCGPMELIETL